MNYENPSFSVPMVNEAYRKGYANIDWEKKGDTLHVVVKSAVQAPPQHVDMKIVVNSTYRCPVCLSMEPRGGVCGSTGYFDGTGYVHTDPCQGQMEPVR